MKLSKKSNDQIIIKLSRLRVKASEHAIYEDSNTNYMSTPNVVGYTTRGARIERRIDRTADKLFN